MARDYGRPSKPCSQHGVGCAHGQVNDSETVSVRNQNTLNGEILTQCKLGVSGKLAGSIILISRQPIKAMREVLNPFARIRVWAKKRSGVLGQAPGYDPSLG